MTNQKVNYATAGLLLVTTLAVFTPRVQAEEQQLLDNTQTAIEAPESKGSKSLAPDQPMGNGMQHNIPHEMPGMKSGNMHHDMGNMHHNMSGMNAGDKGNMHHNMSGMNAGDKGNMHHNMSGMNATKSSTPTE